MAKDYEEAGSFRLPRSHDNVIANTFSWGWWKGKPAIQIWFEDQGVTANRTPAELRELAEGILKFLDSDRMQPLLYQEAVKSE